MPFKDWEDYYKDDHFWRKVRLARKKLPDPIEFPKDYFTMRLSSGLILRFKKFYFTTPDGRSLFGQKTIDRIWMFYDVGNPDQYWEFDYEF